MAPDRVAHGRLVGNVGDHQRNVPHGRAMPGLQAVEDDHVAAGRAQRQHGVAADVTGAAGQENGAHYRPIEK